MGKTLVWVQVPPPAPVTVTDALASFEQYRLTLPQLLDDLWSRIEATESRVHAFVSLADPNELLDAGNNLASLPLRGIPLAVKDNICTTQLHTTCGSRMLESYQSPFEATCVNRLRAAGAQVQGKTNLDEFAMGSSTEHSAWGPTRNPFDCTRSPGGSSGGSAAAVAAGEALAALGSDSGGSVRQPASVCGVVGLRPTYGLISRWGLVAFASSLDTIGLITSSVPDCARLLEFIAGEDPRDSTTVNADIPPYSRTLRCDLAGLRIGVPAEYIGDAVGDEALARTAHWQKLARGLGAQIVELNIPALHNALPAYHLLASAEAAANLARYDGVRYTPRSAAQDMLTSIITSRASRLGREVKRRIALGTLVLSAGQAEQYYDKAQHARAWVTDGLRRAFHSVDLLLTPTSPTPAFPLGARDTDPVAMYQSDLFTAPASLAGVPAISIPGGSVDGLPFGLQLIAPRLEEELLLGAAHAMELAVRGDL